MKFFAVISLAVLLSCASVISRADSVPIPPNIVTYNVPALPASIGDRLQRYNNVRSAFVYGWQGDALLIGTRFGQTTQLHRLTEPMGARTQLTFLPEPLGAVAIPRAGAKDQVLISWDVGGSEFDQLFLFNLQDGSSRMVSDGESLNSYVIWAPDERSYVFVSTRRNGANWDIYHQDLNGEARAVLETEQGYWYPVSFSPDGKRILVKHRISINESFIHELNLADGSLRQILGGAPGEKISIGYAGYDGHGGVLFTTDAGSEFLGLQQLDLATGEVTEVTRNLNWDVEGISVSSDYSHLAYSVNAGGVSKVQIRKLPSLEAVPAPRLPNGIVGGLRFAPDNKRVAITLNRPTAPSDVYTFTVGESELVRWTQSEIGGLNAERFVDVELFSYPTFDGRDVPAFIYRPDTPGPHPVLVYIHGGPEGQYRPYFSTLMQSYVTEMGIAVIAPNVRGSNGYGKTYLTLDNGKLREDSVKDIGGLLDWIDTRDDLRSDRVGVMGGSYGGYMVLASMVHYGDRLTAAVESVGISNFVTFLENTQAYRQDIRRVEYGDERDPDMRAHLQDISPLNHVDKMKTPLLILQGANDPRVPASESEQIRLALDEAGVPAWYVLAKDEGHGFRKKANRDFDRAARFAFIEAYLTRE